MSVLTDKEGNALMTDDLRKEREKKLFKFVSKNKDRIGKWVRKNPGLKPPIFFDLSKDEFYWAEPTREQKKAINKELRRQRDETPTVNSDFDTNVPSSTSGQIVQPIPLNADNVILNIGGKRIEKVESHVVSDGKGGFKKIIHGEGVLPVFKGKKENSNT